eukprot:m.81958 g.81958  ORF g.81958 m.81958 type:complete len:59 (+) comp36274_c0_seq1:53-229(+)
MQASLCVDDLKDRRQGQILQLLSFKDSGSSLGMACQVRRQRSLQTRFFTERFLKILGS